MTDIEHGLCRVGMFMKTWGCVGGDVPRGTQLGSRSPNPLPQTYAVAPDADLYQVTQYFIEHKGSAAVVVEDDKVVGVLTTIDALRALMDLVAEARRVLK